MAVPSAPPAGTAPPELVTWASDVHTTAVDHDTRIGTVESGLTAEAAAARNGDNITSGTVADARIAATIARDTEVTAAVAAEAAARATAITTAINNLVNSAPGTLDTLEEIADALGDDANFAATMTTALAAKIAASTLTTDGDILTRAAGVVARITRANLAADTAFASLYALLNDPLNWGFPFSFHPNTGRSNASVVSNNRRYYLRSIGGGTLTAVKLEVGTQSGNISIALYSNTGTGLNAKPGARIVTTGSIACPAAGVQPISLGGSFVLNPGDWFSIAADNTTAAFIAAFNNVAGSTLGAGAFYKEDSAFTAPATATPVSEAGPAFILVGVA